MIGENDVNGGGHLPMLGLTMNSHKNTPTAGWCLNPLDAECRAREAAQAAKKVAEENAREEAMAAQKQAERNAKRAEFEAAMAAERAVYQAKMEAERKREEAIQKAEREREEAAQRLALTCATVPEEVKLEKTVEDRPVPVTIMEDRPVRVTTMKLSRPAAFELVRQALAACPGVDETNPLAQSLRDYVHKHKPSNDFKYGRFVSEGGARMIKLQEMTKEWTGIDLKVHENVVESALYQQPEADVGNEALCFLMVTVMLAHAVNPVSVIMGMIVFPTVMLLRLEGALEALGREETARDWLLNMSRKDLDKFRGEDTEYRWEMENMQKLFDWVETFLTEAFTDVYGVDPLTKFELEYTDELTESTVEEMRARADSFLDKSGKEQTSQY
jgi:hypothetical protein